MCLDERFEAESEAESEAEVAVGKRRAGGTSSLGMPGFGQAVHPPVIFLDIDGVLNRTAGATHIRLDQDLVSRLRTIVARSGCRIVLSTFWRGFDAYVRYILNRHGIDASIVIGVCQ